MKVRHLSKKLEKKVKKLGLTDPYKKAVKRFEANERHPALHYEIMKETKHLNPVLRSFRINRKFRVEGYELGTEFQVINVTSHYQ